MVFVEEYCGWSFFRLDDGRYKAICQVTGSEFTAATRSDLRALIGGL